VSSPSVGVEHFLSGCGMWMGKRTPRVEIVECSAYMWVVLPGTEVAHGECGGCKWLRTSKDRSS